MSLTPDHLRTLGQKASDALSKGLGAIHSGMARLLVWVGRRLARVLSFLPWSCKLALPSAVLAPLALWFWLHARTWLVETAELAPGHLDLLRKQGWTAWFDAFCLLGLGVGLVLGVAALLAFLRKPFSFLVLRIGAASFAAWWLGFLIFVVRVPGALFAANPPYGGFDKGMRNGMWIDGVVLWLGPVLVVAAYLLCVFLRSAKEFYGGRVGGPAMVGDRIVEDLRTHGGDPVFRTSLYWAVFLHAFFIFLLPYALTRGFGAGRAYGIPLGSGVSSIGGGDPVVKMITVKAPKKRKPRVRYVLNVNTAIYFHVPDLEDSDALHAVEEATQLTYAADRNAVFGKPGAGGRGGGKLGAGGGKTGGWPEGTAKARIRFIRLEYSGPDWDDGMDAKSRADINFLAEFERLTGLKAASRSEGHPIRLLRKYDKGYAPPFVYMTGSGAINIPPSDVKILRDYLLEGGMLFADCGSPQWDAEFRRFVLALFPGKRLSDIPDDDPIFQMPYVFPNAAPPLWHHGGMRALGIKHKDRWVVFYHPGDVNDAWKTGHSGLRPELAKAAHQLGVNIVYYAFTHYLDQTRKYRK